MKFKKFCENTKSRYYVGVVGFSGRKFDEQKAESIIKTAFDSISENDKSVSYDSIVIVSGLTALGIPLLAYEEATRRGWETVGVACKKAEEYDLYPVDEKKIIGNDWGEESQSFLNMLDHIIRIGGGKQSFEEVATAKGMGIRVLEYDLEEIK